MARGHGNLPDRYYVCASKGLIQPYQGASLSSIIGESEMSIRFAPLLFLAFALAEIAGFIIVGRAVGVAATLGLIVLSGIVGVVLLRQQGFGVIARIREEAAAGRVPGGAIADGAMIVVAGILLVIPGFITDIVGLLLFFPPVRAAIKSALMPGIVGFATGPASRWPSTPSSRPTIDITPPRDQ